MSYLWAVGTPATPAEVQAAVAPDLAYTTVMTILTRLWQKGRLTREPRGRAFAYSPVETEAEHRAQVMRNTLDDANDRAAVLSQFVGSLKPGDAKLLRRLLGGRS